MSTNLKSRAKSTETKYLLLCCLKIKQFIWPSEETEAEGKQQWQKAQADIQICLDMLQLSIIMHPHLQSNIIKGRQLSPYASHGASWLKLGWT